MPLCALICRFRSVRFKPIRKFDGHLVKIYRRPKRATQVEISKKLFPDYHDRRTTEQICSNVYIHSDFSIDIDLPWKGSEFVAATGKLYLLIRLTFLLADAGI
ncbi:hypothetical protein T03_1734 [Trichinella britovi]|uniref:Uncharacterized protein n=1 Tax=Trichinella britovi TaxID=45882 RepID=A0A0V1C985_TRIBR|nr:hypothetical protein T03_1734 [Trichinella britovi]